MIWYALTFLGGMITGPALFCAYFAFMDWKHGVGAWQAQDYYPSDPYTDHLDHVEDCEFCKRNEEAA